MNGTVVLSFFEEKTIKVRLRDGSFAFAILINPRVQYISMAPIETLCKQFNYENKRRIINLKSIIIQSVYCPSYTTDKDCSTVCTVLSLSVLS